MATSRSQHVENATVDLGAQYVTATNESFKLHKRWVNRLINFINIIRFGHV